MNQSEFPAITWNLLKEGEKCTHKVPLVLVLLLIVEKLGKGFLANH